MTKPTTTTPLELLTRGEIAVKGRMPWSSNYTFLVELALDGTRGHAIYKPERGERPLWDFPSGLYKREIAAYRLSEALGWGIVPLTIARDGPHGPGSLQHFIEADFEQHYFTLREDPAHRERLQQICLFDLVTNNADRKSGHCLLGPDGAVYAIDNGLTFHVDPKLRTVIWDFGGEPIPEKLVDDLRRVVTSGIPDSVTELIAPDERKTLLRRMRSVLKAGAFPTEHGSHHYPWPPV